MTPSLLLTNHTVVTGILYLSGVRGSTSPSKCIMYSKARRWKLTKTVQERKLNIPSSRSLTNSILCIITQLSIHKHLPQDYFFSNLARGSYRAMTHQTNCCPLGTAGLSLCICGKPWPVVLQCVRWTKWISGGGSQSKSALNSFSAFTESTFQSDFHFILCLAFSCLPYHAKLLTQTQDFVKRCYLYIFVCFDVFTSVTFSGAGIQTSLYLVSHTGIERTCM